MEVTRKLIRHAIRTLYHNQIQYTDEEIDAIPIIITAIGNTNVPALEKPNSELIINIRRVHPDVSKQDTNLLKFYTEQLGGLLLMEDPVLSYWMAVVHYRRALPVVWSDWLHVETGLSGFKEPVGEFNDELTKVCASEKTAFTLFNDAQRFRILTEKVREHQRNSDGYYCLDTLESLEAPRPTDKVVGCCCGSNVAEVQRVGESALKFADGRGVMEDITRQMGVTLLNEALNQMSGLLSGLLSA